MVGLQNYQKARANYIGVILIIVVEEEVVLAQPESRFAKNSKFDRWTPIEMLVCWRSRSQPDTISTLLFTTAVVPPPPRGAAPAAARAAPALKFLISVYNSYQIQYQIVHVVV
jgi:hypothetical protein